MSLLPVNRGEGGRRRPLSFLNCGSVRNVFRRRLIRIAEQYGECWVQYRDGSNGQIKIELNAMFDEDLIVPIPRIAKQPRELMRFQATPKGVTNYGGEHAGQEQD